MIGDNVVCFGVGCWRIKQFSHLVLHNSLHIYNSSCVLLYSSCRPSFGCCASFSEATFSIVVGVFCWQSLRFVFIEGNFDECNSDVLGHTNIYGEMF